MKNTDNFENNNLDDDFLDEEVDIVNNNIVDLHDDDNDIIEKLSKNDLEENPDIEEEQQTIGENDQLVEDILKLKGIIDPSKIKYENEDGEIEEVDFYSLTPEEKLEVLTSNDIIEDNDNDLSDDEADIINFMRENNLGKDDLATYFKNEAIKELQDSYEERYEIDDISDDDLYFNHLKSTSPSMTDEEIQEELDLYKVNPDLYKKRVESIREYYRDAQRERDEAVENERIQNEAKELEDFKKTLTDASSQVESVGEILLEDQDKNDVNSYVLDQDANGVSKFAKDLNDPKKLFIAAWFLLKGDEAFSVIHDHYKKQIENARKDPGQANAKPQSSQATSKGGNNRVVVKNNDQKTTRNHKTNNMIKHDFFD